MSSSSSPSLPSSSSSSLPSLSWVGLLPKVDLHAHLSGCVRQETVKQLLEEEAQQQSSSTHTSNDLTSFQFGDRTLSQCFEVFKILHRLVSNRQVLGRITREVIRDFAQDGCVYLELRTTPRALSGGAHGSACTKREYIECVIDAIRELESTVRTPSGEPICVRLLLSIDRSQSLEEANDTLDLAIEFARRDVDDPIIVGIDFSGNPTISTFRSFLPIFQRAREAGLKSSIHIGEKLHDTDDLNCVLFDFRPERIGHVVCLDPPHVEQLLTHPIPIEICPTSNLKTQIVKEWQDHPFGAWRTQAAERQLNYQHPDQAVSDLHRSHYPMVICTDDSGVFNITLTSEVHRVCETFSLSHEDIFHLEQRSLEYGFIDRKKKEQLRQIFQTFHQKQFGTNKEQTNTKIDEEAQMC